MQPPANSKTDQHLVEKALSSEELLKGKFLHAFRDTVELPNGAQTTREYVVHPGAVMIIPLLDNGDLVLERQYRYPMCSVMIEFPAGKLEPKEDRLSCAKRELLEETGYSATHWARAGVCHPVISYSTEFIEIWFAKGLKQGETSLDEGEFVEVIHTSCSTFFEWCKDGVITDAKTLTGALWLQNWLNGSWPLNWQE